MEVHDDPWLDRHAAARRSHRRTIATEDIRGDWLRDYLGGRGLAARYLLDELDPQVDPLSPANKLIFSTGPLTGTPLPCGARYMVVTKGALTDAITTSNSGGHWGPELMFAGYDMVIVEGRYRETRVPVRLRRSGRAPRRVGLVGIDRQRNRGRVARRTGIPQLSVAASVRPARSSCALRASSTTSTAPRDAAAWAR